MATSEGVELGFVELIESWRLLCHFFPSKVGGKPAWLALSDLPNPAELACGKCGKPCIFLLQIYAPVNEKPTCFHRTVFVFICKDPACYQTNDNSNFVVFRSQLDRKNAFYGFEPPVDDELSVDHPRADDHQSMCLVCGCAGPKRCGKCHKATYCSKEHQTAHWKKQHKKLCSQGNIECSIEYLFPELDIETEPEEWDEDTDKEKSEEQNMNEYEKFMAEKGSSESSLVDPKMGADLEKMAKQETEEDETFNQFKKRVEKDPKQVLRYERDGKPLWVSNEGILEPNHVPNCFCGAPRKFEFQIMPQLLNELKVDSLSQSIDWGTLVVYTCSKSCDSSSNYHKEFLWKQDFSSSEL